MAKVPDYGEREDIAEASLAELTRLAFAQQEAEAKVTQLEDDLKTAKVMLREISERRLPELMDSIGMEKFKTKDGIEINVRERIHASIPEINAGKAFSWLEEHGEGGLIKRQFTIEFDKAELAWAKKFEADCKKRKKPLRLKRKETVHPMTLGAYIGEALANGVDVPLDLFGAFRQRFTKINLPG